MLEMKPKMKAHVHFAPTEDGVYIKTWSTEFVMKGKGLYQWIERLATYYNGKQTLGELTANLSEAQRVFILQITSELIERGVIIDAAAIPVASLSETEEKLYEDTLAYLEEHCLDGKLRFQQFRKKRLLIIGAGKSFKACVRALMRMGLQSPILMTTEPLAVQGMLKEWSQRDPAFQVNWIDHITDLDQEISLDGILYANDSGSHKDMSEWSHWARQQQIPFLPTIVESAMGWIGPIEDQWSHLTLNCVWDRFYVEHRDSDPLPVAFYVLLGNIAALECFKYYCQLPELGVRDQIVYLHPKNLETQIRSIIPSPLSNTGIKEQTSLQVKEVEEQTEFLQRVERLTDSQFGLLLKCEPGDLWQIPLPLMSATVHLPNSLQKAPFTVIAAGETIQDATEQVVREALTSYARTWEEVEASSETEMTIWSHGRTYAEWIGTGLIRAYAEKIKERRALRHLEKLIKNSISSLKYRQYIKMIEKRYERMIHIIEIPIHLPNSYYTCVIDGQYMLGEGWGRSRAEALDLALFQSISFLQILENHPDQIQNLNKHPWQGVTEWVEVEWVEDHSQTPSWEKWLEQVIKYAQAMELEIISKHWQKEKILSEIGLWIGQVGWKGGENIAVADWRRAFQRNGQGAITI